METQLSKKEAALRKVISDSGSALIAYSGGIDSSLVTYIAHQELGDKMLAITAHGPLIPRFLDGDAKKFTTKHKIPQLSIDINHLDVPEVKANDKLRCYHCKSHLLKLCQEVAKEKGFSAIFDGSNHSDHNGYRPGMKALEEYEVRSPLAEAGLIKQDVRELAKALGLDNWDKPAYSCLATRFPYGTELSKERLLQIDKAEAALRKQGFERFRVRFHGDVARIEMDPDEMPALFDRAIMAMVSSKLKKFGFLYVALDMEGYRSGSMDEALPDEEM